MTPIKPTDVNRYITTIRINFENAYKTQTDEEREILIKSWFAILKDYPKEIVDKAVINAIKYAKFAPRIGDIVEQIEKMQVAYEKSNEELWAELTGVLREVARNVYRFHFTYVEFNGKTQGENARKRVKDIYNGLSAELKDYLRNTQGLIELAEYTDEQLSYERGRFMRTIPEIKQRAKTRHEVGEQLAGLIQGLTAQFKLDCESFQRRQIDEKGQQVQSDKSYS